MHVSKVWRVKCCFVNAGT